MKFTVLERATYYDEEYALVRYGSRHMIVNQYGQILQAHARPTDLMQQLDEEIGPAED